MNLKNSKGFTLIELMIVVAIIAILAAIALPAYQNYIKRAKVTEGVVAADACKASVSEYVASQNAWPGTIAQAGCDGFVASQYVAALDYGTGGNGVITVTYQNVGTGVDAADYVLGPSGVQDPLTGQITAWTCTASTVESQLLPAACRP
jgi:type IV pilus assembly protein PilA